MNMINVGYDFRHPSDFRITRPDGGQVYYLLIIRSPAYIRMGSKEYYTKKHCCIVFDKDTPQLFGGYDGDFINDFVLFAASQEEIDYLKQIGLPFDTVIQLQDVLTLSGYVKQIFTERWSNNPNADRTIDLLLRLLLHKVADYYATGANTGIQLDEKLNLLRRSIFAHPQNNWSVAEICNSMDISRTYLHNKYKQLFGNGIKQDITLSRLEYSKYLLANTHHTVFEIAAMSGYVNDVHFMRVFKRATGLTPSQYRKSSAASPK